MRQETIPQLVAEIIRIKSMIGARNYLKYDFRESVKRQNDRDAERIKRLEKQIKLLKRERGWET